MDKLSKTWS